MEKIDFEENIKSAEPSITIIGGYTCWMRNDSRKPVSETEIEIIRMSETVKWM